MNTDEHGSYVFWALPYDVVMKARTNNTGTRNGARTKRKVSRLGRELRRISDHFFASGGKALNRREIEREVAERRGGR